MSAHTLLPAEHLDHADYTASGGYIALEYAMTDPDRARRALLATELTGLGGAHFPLARKIESLLGKSGPRTVVCNAAEDEPGSRKDRTLLSRNPHLVLEGVLVAATLLDATDVVMYIGEIAHDAIRAVLAAIEEAAATQSTPCIERVRVVKAPPRYLSLIHI